MIRVILLSIVVLGFVSASFGAKSIPKYITLCKKNDPNISECFRQQLTNVIKKLNKGIPEMNLRKVDPLLIEKLNFQIGGKSSLSLHANLTDMQLFGLSLTEPTLVEINFEKIIYKFNFYVPALRMESKYKARGKVLLLEFDSEGSFWGNFTDIYATGTWIGKKFMKNGQEHMKLGKGDVDVDIKNIKMYFSNIFPNNDEITASTNEAINENIDELYQEIKPIILETISTVVVDASDNVNNLFPINKLFPED